MRHEMYREPQALPDAESAIVNAIWRLGSIEEATLRAYLAEHGVELDGGFDRAMGPDDADIHWSIRGRRFDKLGWQR